MNRTTTTYAVAITASIILAIAIPAAPPAYEVSPGTNYILPAVYPVSSTVPIEVGVTDAFVADTLMSEPTPKPYSDADLDLLARLINAEAGSNDCTDEHQLLVGNVVLNRVADKRYPDTIRAVIYDTKYGTQYTSAWDGALDKRPSERAMRNAMRLLEGERFCDNGVIKQAEFVQGEIYKSFQTQYVTTYFCY